MSDASKPLAVLSLLITGLMAPSCGRQPSPEAPAAPSTAPPPVKITYALALHGGVGVLAPGDEERADTYRQALTAALTLGRDLLADGSAALQVVERVVRVLEDDPKFNAGKGAVFTSEGTHELDAAIMDGRTLAAGAVAGLRAVRNPISLARLVMERSPHVLLAGDGAERFGREMRVERVRPSYFYTAERYQQWRQAVAAGATPSGFGTVGAVALDRYGNLAAGSSTGGLTDKRFGRIGDVPVIGAGTYANNRTAAISCTGRGEEFIRHAVAHEISAQIEHAGRNLLQAATDVLENRLEAGDGGLIGVTTDGFIAMVFTTPGMYRGAADSNGRFEVSIWRERATANQGIAATAPSP